MTPPILPRPSLKISMKGLRSSASTTARRSSGLSNGGAVWLTISVRLPVATVVSQIACGAWLLTSFKNGIETPYGKGHVDFPGGERQHPRREVGDDRVLDAVEIGPARLPIVRIAGQPDQLVWLIFNELE